MNQIVSPKNFYQLAVVPALNLLGTFAPKFNTKEAAVQIVATAMQESKLESRWQIIDRNNLSLKGPARSFLQFEQGTPASRGGIYGVFLHDASRQWLNDLCAARAVKFSPQSIYAAVEVDDIFACAVGRLMYFTSSKRLPNASPGGLQQGWDIYVTTWNPGKPKPESWPMAWSTALEVTA